MELLFLTLNVDNGDIEGNMQGYPNPGIPYSFLGELINCQIYDVN